MAPVTLLHRLRAAAGGRPDLRLQPALPTLPSFLAVAKGVVGLGLAIACGGEVSSRPCAQRSPRGWRPLAGVWRDRRRYDAAACGGGAAGGVLAFSKQIGIDGVVTSPFRSRPSWSPDLGGVEGCRCRLGSSRQLRHPWVLLPC